MRPLRYAINITLDAREMHDVVAHNLLVMVTLSEGAALKQDDSQAVSWQFAR